MVYIYSCLYSMLGQAEISVNFWISMQDFLLFVFNILILHNLLFLYVVKNIQPI